MKDFMGVIAGSKLLLLLMFLIIAMAAADAGFYMLRTEPAVSKSDDLSAQIDVLQTDINEKAAQRSLYNSYQGGSKDLELFRKAVPRREQYVDIMNAVYKLAKLDNMDPSSFATSTTEVAVGDFVEVSFNMPISGSYEDVRKFIYDVESSPLFLTVSKLSLSSGAEGGMITLNMEYSTYMKRDETPYVRQKLVPFKPEPGKTTPKPLPPPRPVAPTQPPVARPVVVTPPKPKPVITVQPQPLKPRSVPGN